jgi:CheY-like chemotaxis protein
MAKVLLVDSNQDSQAALSRALAEAGYEVAVASNGSSAVASLEWERPDLVVSHAKIDDMDGYELFTRIRKDPMTLDTPFLLIAGWDRPVALAAAEAGVDVVLTGDFRLDAVMGKVGDVLLPASEGVGRPVSAVEENGARKPTEPLWAALQTVAARPSSGSPGAAFQGSLEVMDLAEVTQAVGLGGKTGCLLVALAAGEAAILFESGRVVHATFRGVTGEPAFAAIIVASQRETEATFRFNRMERAEVAQGPRTICRGVDQLLLTIAVGIDEGETAGAPLEDVSPVPRADG